MAFPVQFTFLEASMYPVLSWSLPCTLCFPAAFPEYYALMGLPCKNFFPSVYPKSLPLPPALYLPSQVALSAHPSWAKALVSLTTPPPLTQPSLKELWDCLDGEEI